MTVEEKLQEKTDKFFYDLAAVCRAHNACITIPEGTLIFLDSERDDKGQKMVMHTYFVARNDNSIKIEYPNGETGITVTEKVY